MEKKIRSLLCICLASTAIAFVVSCQANSPKGSVLVHAPSSGRFDIYRIASSDPMQFVAEEVGHFNKSMDVDPGSYLILTDCSSQTVIVHPHTHTELIAHRLKFVPPSAPKPGDLFTIQCERFQKTESRQFIENRFEIDVLAGQRQILVGLVPLIVETPDSSAASKPVVKTYPLGAINVRSGRRSDGNQLFFVSSSEGLLSVTASQNFGKNLYLLPGKYRIEVNGTKRQLELSSSATHNIETSFLKITTPPGVDLSKASQIKGSALLVEIDREHSLGFNEIHAMLPSEVSLRLSGSDIEEKISLQEGQLFEYPVRSVQVDLSCSPWEWICLGGRKVYLYNKGQPYPFVSGVSDVPILFVGNDIEVGLEGSRDLRYKLPAGQNQTLKTGTIEISPIPESRVGLVTDLLRIEALKEPVIGSTLDLKIDGNTSLPAIVGSYSVVSYTSYAHKDAIRSRNAASIRVQEGQLVKVQPRIYLSEKKMSDYSKMQEKRRSLRANRDQERNYSRALPSKWR